MSQINLYFISITVSILIGIGLTLYIRKPLHTLLVDVCGTQERARFWVTITVVSYLLISAAIGLAFQPEVMHYEGRTEFNQGVVYEERFYYETVDYDPVIYNLGSHIGRTLFGLLLMTGFMAFTISRFIRREQKAQTLVVGGK